MPSVRDPYVRFRFFTLSQLISNSAKVATLCRGLQVVFSHFLCVIGLVVYMEYFTFIRVNYVLKARSAFVNLRHLWRRRDVSFSLKGRVYSASVRSVLLYGSESWPIRVEDMRRLSAFDNGCLRRIARVRWQHRVTSNDVRRRVLGNASISFNKLVLLRQLRWLGHVLRMAPERLPRRALFARQGPGWKRPRCGQPSTWRQHMKSLTSCLAAVGPVRLPGWGPKDGECQWLRTLEDMARNRNQWKNCVQCCVDSH
ncbi:unnamed protein product, partial [Dicrocoelium dendriticum]